MIIERINNNYEEERLYSTGNDELDELMERAFCEGYEYAQKEFGKIGDWFEGRTEGDWKRKSKTLKKHGVEDARSWWMRPTKDGTVIKSGKNGPEKIVDPKLYKLYKKAAVKNQLGKAAMIATPVVAAVGTGVAIKKHKDKKKKEE